MLRDILNMKLKGNAMVCVCCVLLLISSQGGGVIQLFYFIGIVNTKICDIGHSEQFG